MAINANIDRLKSEIEDTIIIVTADHGHTDVKDLFLNDYPEIMECLKILPSMEPRAVSFHLRSECVADFPEKFNSLLGEYFILVSHDRYIKEFLGPGIPHPRSEEFVGDFVAIAVKDRMLRYKPEGIKTDTFAAHHAGLTGPEMLVPLIVIDAGMLQNEK